MSLYIFSCKAWCLFHQDITGSEETIFLSAQILLILTTPSISHLSKILKLSSPGILFSKLIYEGLAELLWMWEQV